MPIILETVDDLIQSKFQLSNPVKLVYLSQALKDGSPRPTIEGLSETGINYREAFTMLEECYDRPRLLHLAHLHVIVEAPSLKHGNGRNYIAFMIS